MDKYEFIGKSVFIRDKKILIISDLHIGYEESLQISIPNLQYKIILKELEEIFKKTGKLDKIIILGDLKHEFGKISGQEWKETSELISFLQKKTDKIILIKGNHDKMLEPIARNKNLEVKEIYINEEFGFLHGNKNYSEIMDKKIKLIFLGHLHPAISIRENVKQETYKCFLVGKYKNKEIIILPSFFPLVEGQDVLIENTNLVYKFDLKNFKVFIPIEDKILDFGKVKAVGSLV